MQKLVLKEVRNAFSKLVGYQDQFGKTYVYLGMYDPAKPKVINKYGKQIIVDDDKAPAIFFSIVLLFIVFVLWIPTGFNPIAAIALLTVWLVGASIFWFGRHTLNVE